MRIVFPTVENLSYMSEVATNFTNAKYFTVLNLSGQTISSVEMLENRNEDIVKLFKNNSFNALVTSDTNDLPIEDLKKVGVSIFKETNRKKVLALYSDFVQDKLKKI
ncbi:NifB/NifX family molybdenum-iron cluster-binding protein [Malaciobacter marinus]|uniref:Dinitrogenase iron-molybdenum cofactor biosynthesis domain-containing protein n=1 Tax=Malaciobacter marinus TaxID=505249 RepID=A0A347TME9_9BACT|nr:MULTISPECIES: hypothetical protein [Malaciobacter]AXX87777.1 hypothetical protein AMRN_2062 [Malaciobacter marinus]PHO12458.1 hypothetical protein CPG38_07695 [Malaciobacter marinus]PHO16532.1 hypothetical protein CPH92_01245 [Malaciobacter marinus]RYA22933.1 hypothetical protein CRU96_10355 [Malaciobacter halophilus]